MARNRLDAALDAHTSNLSKVQEELAVQRLLSAFDPKRADIVQYLQRFSEKTEELGWTEEKKKNTLKYMFDSKTNKTILENIDRPLGDLIGLIKSSIQKDLYGDHSTLLAKRFDVQEHDPERFLKEKFVVFEQKGMTEEDQFNWLRASLPDDFDLHDIDHTKLLDRLKAYAKRIKFQTREMQLMSEQLKAIEKRLFETGQATKGLVNTLETYRGEDRRRFDRGFRGHRNDRRDSRSSPYKSYNRVPPPQSQSRPSYDCWICRKLGIGGDNAPNRKHWPDECRNRFEAYYKGIADPAKVERSHTKANLAIEGPVQSDEPLDMRKTGKYFSLILIFVRLNGFQGIGIYDTGANRSVIDRKTASRLRLSFAEISEPVSGVCGSSLCRHLATGSLSIGRLTRQATFLVLDVTFGDNLLIGLDLIHLFRLSQSQQLEIFQDGVHRIELFQPVLSRSNLISFSADLEKVHQLMASASQLSASQPVAADQLLFANAVSVIFRENSSKFLFGPGLFAFSLLNEAELPFQTKLSVPKFELNFRKSINPDLPPEWIDRIERILVENDCFARDEFDVGLIKNDFYSIPLKPDSNPVFRRPYHISEEDLVALNRTIDILIERGVLRESFSNFAAGVVLVDKKDTKTKRLTIDFRGLNQITLDLEYPFPTIEEMIDSIGGKKFLSTLDMNVAFWHFPVLEEDIHKTAFRTPERHLEFTRMPMGHKNAPAVMQRGLQRIIIRNSLSKFCKNFFDDINVHSDSLDDHCLHLEKVLQCFKNEGIKIKLSKCKFGFTSVVYLGHRISQNRVEPLISHVEAIINFPRPQNVHDLQRLLGKVNYHRRFIPNATELLNPFFLLLNKDAVFVWSEACERTFEKCKEILTSEPVLAVHHPGRKCILYVDASGVGIGCVFKQVQEDGSEKPISYFSRKLLPYQRNYCATEKECLAIVEAINHYHLYLFDKEFTVVSDHDSLRYLLNIKNKNARLLKWSIALSGYRFAIRYQKGSANVEADCLSRAPIDKTCVLEPEELRNFSTFLNLLQRDELIREQRLATIKGIPNFEVIDGIFTDKQVDGNKILVPLELQKTLVERLHSDRVHPGIDQMLMMLRPNYKFVDSSMRKVIEDFVRNCKTCIENKSRYDRALGFLSKIGPAREPFDFVSIDSAGGFQGSSDAQYLHLAIDHHTRYGWFFCSGSNSANDILRLIEIVMKDGRPKRILSDNHRNLDNKKLSSFAVSQGITLINVPPDAASANGMIERFVQTATNKIRCAFNESPGEIPWELCAEKVVRAYNETPHSVTRFKPVFLLKGEEEPTSILANSPPCLEEARQLAYERSIAKNARNAFYYDKNRKNYKIEVGDLVYCRLKNKQNRQKLERLFLGPFKVIAKISEVIYRISWNKRFRNVHLRNIRVAAEDRH